MTLTAMRSCIAVGLVVVVAACGDDVPAPRTEVAIIPALANRELDVLFLIDNSPSSDEWQASLKIAMPAFLDELASLDGTLPDLHIGVVTSDMGTHALDGQYGHSIPGSVGGCSSTEIGGQLKTYGGLPAGQTFVSDMAAASGDGTRDRNYTGELPTVLSAIMSAGSAGCGFEQDLAAITAAIDPANNAGFIRPEADLAVLVLGDEDDCSISDHSFFDTDTTILGPLQSFRCTQFGVTCDTGGDTEAAMNALGPKSDCHANHASPYVADPQVFVDALKASKPDPSNVMVGVIVGDPAPFDVEARAPTGSQAAISALASSCSVVRPSHTTTVADPAVRLVEFAHAFSSRNMVRTICSNDYGPAATSFAFEANRMLGSDCLDTAIAMPAACDVTVDDTTLPECSDVVAGDCWHAIADPARCPLSPANLRIAIERSVAPTTQNYAHVRCVVP